MAVEEQVVQIYAATNGFVDRISSDKVERFLAEMIERVRGSSRELLDQIASGDWSEQTQAQVAAVVEQFANDFGFDLDEEGHPLQEDAEPVRSGVADGASTQPVDQQPAEEKEPEAALVQ
jgi:F-type H+-transporting ATPase subunit alpha